MNPIDTSSFTPRNLIAARPDDPKTPQQVRARETAEEFEAVFLSQMLSQMNLGLDPDSAFGGGKGEAAYQSLVAEKYGEAMTEMGGVGIADTIYKEILRLQEGGR